MSWPPRPSLCGDGGMLLYRLLGRAEEETGESDYVREDGLAEKGLAGIDRRAGLGVHSP